MGLFDKIKNGFQSPISYAKMDEFLIEEIDDILCRHWTKVSQRTPTNIAGVSLADEAEFEFAYKTPTGLVHVEMEHEWPILEIEMKTRTDKFEIKLIVSDFVEKQGKELKLVNKEELENNIEEMRQMVV